MLEIFLLQTPSVLLDGKPVIFPYKKAEALFYYMAVQGKATRDEIAALLWEDCPNDIAHKNLRHALYMVKRAMGAQYILSPQRNLLVFQADVKSDVDNLINHHQFQCYHEEFLHGFQLLDAENFEEWLLRKREYFRKVFLFCLFSYFAQSDGSDMNSLEVWFARYVAEDPYDEHIVTRWMQLCDQNHLFLKGIHAYKRLAKALNDELGIDPCDECTQQYRQLLTNWNAATHKIEESASQISLRKRELSLLAQLAETFQKGGAATAIIRGERGVGKTYLIKTALAQANLDKSIILQINCYESRQQFGGFYSLHPLFQHLAQWVKEHEMSIPRATLQAVSQIFPAFVSSELVSDSLPLELSNDYTLLIAEQGIRYILSRYLQQSPLVLVVENLQWMDPYSLELLQMIWQTQPKHLFLLCTCSNVCPPKLDTILSNASSLYNVSLIFLPRFTLEEMRTFLELHKLPTELSEEQLQSIFSLTEGNAFFLNEVSKNLQQGVPPNNLTEDARELLEARLSELTTQARQLLNLLSLFHEAIPLELLKCVIGTREDDILESLEQLQLYSLIHEVEQDNCILFQFEGSILQEYVYAQMLPSQKRLLHNRVAMSIESLGRGYIDNMYTHLIYHYTMGHNLYKALYYKVKWLDVYSSTCYELFPMIESNTDGKPPDTDTLLDLFQSIEREVLDLYHLHSNKSEVDALMVSLLLSKGRYCINDCFYEEGLSCINRLLLVNRQLVTEADRLKVLRLAVYYGIQMHQPEKMIPYITEGLSLSEKIHRPEDHAVFMRLYGLYMLFVEDFLNAESCLQQSIEEFKNAELSPQRYILNIAANYNYLGEIFRCTNRFKQATQWYQRAISLCQKNGVSINPLFQTNLACVMVHDHKPEQAEALFSAAKLQYDRCTTQMCRSVANAGCAYYAALHAKTDLAKDYIQEAIRSSAVLGSPVEIAFAIQTAYWLQTVKGISIFPDTKALRNKLKISQQKLSKTVYRHELYVFDPKDVPAQSQS